jgi:predicted RNA-binding protein YlqC (UPF0109 family)
MEDLLEFLSRALVDRPDEVSVEGFEEDDGTVVLEIRVADDDVGKIIGRGGRTVSSLRTVMRAVASRQDERVLVDVVDE